MDPLGALFASYLEMVSDITINHYTDRLGIEAQAKVVQYHGVQIPYSFQLWRIQDRSVCRSYAHDMVAFSDCTLKAQKLFQEVCQHMQANLKQDWRFKKQKSMYCNAAVNFRPTMAQISAAPQRSDLEQAERKCNLAIAAAMGTSDSKLLRARRDACDAYKQLQTTQ